MTKEQRILSHRESVKRHRAANRDWYDKYQREYIATHPKTQEQRRAALRKWQEANPGYQRKYYQQKVGAK